MICKDSFLIRCRLQVLQESCEHRLTPRNVQVLQALVSRLHLRPRDFEQSLKMCCGVGIDQCFSKTLHWWRHCCLDFPSAPVKGALVDGVVPFAGWWCGRASDISWKLLHTSDNSWTIDSHRDARAAGDAWEWCAMGGALFADWWSVHLCMSTSLLRAPWCCESHHILMKVSQRQIDNVWWS